ncbi:MAG TPA: type II toxin-antitoxin system antitoxin SocA domain-containing protein [Edaphobacter sp.]|nr:type II toxin-antitoxin system antitoxin SocA domain-containing protein [Edaphobacter sp.]
MRYGNTPFLVAEYFLFLADNERRPLSPMQILKLVYIAHGWMLGLHNRPLVNEPIEAWQYGPVIRSLYQRYKKYGSRPVDDGPAQRPSGFEDDERRTMEQVWSGYGQWSAVSLSALTHETGSPWDITVKESGMGSVIPNDLIEDHYRRLAHNR